MSKINIPIIKNLPEINFDELVGVQPMTGPVGKIFTLKVKYSLPDEYYPPYRVVDETPYGHRGWVAVDIETDSELEEWITEQPRETWIKCAPVLSRSSSGAIYGYTQYQMDGELFTLLMLKWS